VRVGITVHPDKEHAVSIARKIVDSLRGRVEVVIATENADTFTGAGPAEPLATMQADALIAIGGDGTFLWSLQRSSIPLLPIHAGTVGFLAEVEGESTTAVEQALDRLCRGDFHLEERMRLSTEIDGRHLPDATNDVVVHTAQVARMRQFELAVDGEVVGVLRADGLILATPTGSTSYSLSASGPVVDPSLDALEFTAIAPFRSSQRSVVFDSWRTIGLRLLPVGKDGVVVVDGQSEFVLRGGEQILVYRSPRRATFIRFGTRFVPHLIGKGILPWNEERLPRPQEGHAALPTRP
jgi:NAD+ kinase